MRIDFSAVLMNLANKAPMLTDGDKPLTLGCMCTIALQNPRKPLSAKQQIEDVALAERILQNDILDLTAEQIVLLKSRIEDTNKPVAYVRACAILDPMEEEKPNAGQE